MEWTAGLETADWITILIGPVLCVAGLLLIARDVAMERRQRRRYQDWAARRPETALGAVATRPVPPAGPVIHRPMAEPLPRRAAVSSAEDISVAWGPGTSWYRDACASLDEPAYPRYVSGGGGDFGGGGASASWGDSSTCTADTTSSTASSPDSGSSSCGSD